MRIDDGHATLVEFSAIPGIKVWEKEVTPPGISGGGPTDTTTMRNTEWRTQSPKHLKTLTPLSFTAAYDPAVFPELVANINVNQQVTLTWPDGATLQFWGWIDDAAPGANAEGEQPTMDITVQPSNHDNDGNEVDPDFVTASSNA